MMSLNARVAVPVLLVAALAAWFALPRADTGPEATLSARRAHEEGLPPAGSASTSRARPTGVGSPSPPSTDETPAAAGAPTDRSASSKDAGGDPELRAEARRQVGLRARDVADALHDASDRLRESLSWDETTYQAVVASVTAAEDELLRVQEAVGAGRLDVREAQAQIVDIREDALRGIESVVGEAQGDAMRTALGMPSSKIAVEDAWEGMPIEDWSDGGAPEQR